ncbi:rRNA pseudouridine synthase [Patescibacteria group bacterium]|nr:rRNA pseudouridine synthase [Patescibacteria group bacterium]
MEKIRLQKFIADRGIASRRKAEEFILAGRVKVNGNLVKTLGAKIDPDQDEVFVDNRKIDREQSKKIVVMLNKPAGYVCTTRQFKNEKNVLDLVDLSERLYPVGRLDKNTSGLLILSNDGALALKLTHPRYEKEKEYWVKVNKPIPFESLQKLARGVELADGMTLRAKTKPDTADSFFIILKQGKKRQIRRMCAEIGYHVVELKRIRINKLLLKDLPEGKYKILSPKEIELL